MPLHGTEASLFKLCHSLAAYGLLLTAVLAEPACAENEMPEVELKWEELARLPDTVGLAGPFVGVAGGALIVAGGTNFPDKPLWEDGKKVWHADAYVLSEAHGKWQTGFKLPRSLAYGVSITTGKGIVCIGGGDAEKHYADVFLLTWVKDKERLDCKPWPPLPRAVANACGALLGNTIYLAGGEEKPGATETLKAVWALDLDAAQPAWREIPAWPGAGRTLAIAAVQDGAFYLMGGVDLSTGLDDKPVRRYLRDAYRYSPAEGWKRIADLPNPVCAAPTPAPTVGRNQFLILGGDDGTRAGYTPIEKHPGFPRKILSYDTVADKWMKAGEVRAARVTAPAVRWNGVYVIPSGEMRPGVRSPEVWTLILPGDAKKRE